MKPLLTFTPQMFAAAMSRRKDVTRRVATSGSLNQIDQIADAIDKDLRRNDGLMTEERALWNTFPPPFGPPGTILPMATTWAATHTHNGVKPRLIEHAQILWFDDGTPKPSWAGKSRPARFLPKSLYHLAPQVQIVSNRAEPLNEITKEDAVREGMDPDSASLGTDDLIVSDAAQAMFPTEYYHRPSMPIARYRVLWDTINAKRKEGAYVWHKNPIVWRIEFKLL